MRDKVVSGELNASHMLYGQLYGLQMGLSGPQTAMASLMTLNQNGQGITLANQLHDAGVSDPGHSAKAHRCQPGGHVYLRPDLSDRYARHVAQLLAGERGHPSAE